MTQLGGAWPDGYGIGTVADGRHSLELGLNRGGSALPEGGD
jgi:hypothetical protein